MHTIEGRFDVAQGVLDESDSVDDAIGEARIGSGRLALAATGEKVCRHRPESRDDLTAQEGADRSARPRGRLQPRNRRPAVPEPANRGMAAAQGVRKAWDQLAEGT